MMRRLLFLLPAMVVLSACGDDGEPDPEPECTPADCSDRGLECGRVDLDDGTCILCGRCTLPEVCGGSGAANQCGCTPLVSCEPGFCGMVDDGCGGQLDCGNTCTSTQTCGGAGLPNRCGARAAVEESCAFGDVACEEGLRCCSTPAGSLCLPGATCPGVFSDIEVVTATLADTVSVFDANVPSGPSCSLFQQCVIAPGARRLLSFEASLLNRGFEALDLGPVAPDNPLTETPMCKQELHLPLLSWRVLTDQGTAVMGGRRSVRCIQDGSHTLGTGPTEPEFSCFLANGGRYGLSRGWMDIQKPDSECAVEDITGLGPGTYTLEVRFDPDGVVPELRKDNNVSSTTFSIQ